MRKSSVAGLTLLLTFLLLAAGNATAATTKALIVGINEYDTEGIKNLNGCVSDCEKYRDFFINQCKIPESNITTLFNSQATKANILSELKKTIHGCSVEDEVVFVFSGHGTQIKDENEDEQGDIQQRDEAMVPYKPIPKDPTSVISDDELGGILDIVKSKLIIIMDCCHSGTGTKAADIAGKSDCVAKYVPSSFFDPVNTQSNEEVSIGDGFKSAFRKRNSGDKGPSNGSYIFFAACKDLELALETSPPASGGKFTFEFLRLMRNNSSGVPSCGEIKKALENQKFTGIVNGEKVEQHPTVEMSKDMLDQTLFARNLTYVSETPTPTNSLTPTPTLPTCTEQAPLETRENTEVCLRPEDFGGMPAFKVDIKITPETNVLIKGNKYLITIISPQDGYLHFINFKPDAQLSIIYPKEKEDHRYIKKDEKISFYLEVDEPPYGMESLLAVVKDEPIMKFNAENRSKFTKSVIISEIKENTKRWFGSGELVFRTQAGPN